MKHLKPLLLIIGVMMFANGPVAAGEYDLHQAVLDNDLQLVQRLLRKGAAINNIGSRKYGYGSALHLAVREGHVEIAKLLLDRGAEVDVLDPDDFTPLHNAAWNGNLEMTELLLAAGADINAGTYDGDTPLTLAQNNDQAQVAEFIQAKLQPAPTQQQISKDPGVFDVSGTYVSEITSHGHAGAGPGPGKIILLLEQHGNTITGTDSSGKADIRGTRTGDTINIEFWAPFWSYGAFAEWKVNVDGTQLKGSWKDRHTGYGEWNLTKIEAEPAQVIDISGTYTSEVTYDDTSPGLGVDPRWYFGNRPDIEINIEQNADKITATMKGDRSGKIEGTIQGNEISFEFSHDVPGGVAKFGSGTWTLGQDQAILGGTWAIKNQGETATGKWNLTKLDANIGSTSANESAAIDVSGTYISETTVSTISSSQASYTKNFIRSKNRKKITLEQTGNAISSVESPGNQEINGTREGNTIHYYINLGNQINGSWEISADGTEMAGKWRMDGAGGASGEWNLKRVQ